MLLDNEEKFFGLNPTPNLMERTFFDDWVKPEEGEKNASSLWEEPAKALPIGVEPTSSVGYEDYNSSWIGRMETNPFKYPDMKMPTTESSALAATWKNKHPEQWSPDDVTLWICSLMNQNSLGFQNTINVQAFLNLSGSQLITMSCKDMQDRDPQNGSYVYTALQNVMSQAAMSYVPTSSYSSPCYTRLEPVNPIAPANDQNQENQNVFRYPGAVNMDTKDAVAHKLSSLNLNLISFDADDDFASIRSFTDTNGDPLQLRNLSLRAFKLSLLESQLPKPQLPIACAPLHVVTPTSTKPLPSPSSDGSQSPTYVTNTEYTLQTRPALQNPSQYSNYSVEVKGNHLWEFIRDLLFDSRYNPSLVKWEDRTEGIFKFVRSDQVAKLWGRKKNNPAMTYEKLSRAMRYYYKRKILERIDGRRLVYKFGPMATGWKA